MTEILKNHTFAAMQIGDQASLTRTVGADDISMVAALSGDVNPASLVPATTSGHCAAHGLWTAGLVSTVLGTRLPGPGTRQLEQAFRFLAPAMPGDAVTATATVIEKRETDSVVLLGVVCTNQHGARVLEGTATVIAPTTDMTLHADPARRTVLLPASRYTPFIDEARSLRPIRAAIVHPCSRAAIMGAIEVRDEGLLDPLLIGPEARIRAAADEAGVSLDGMDIENTEHSHAAAARAVELAVARRVEVLVKGSLHTDELLGAVVARESGLRTERRISHAYVMDVPAYGKPVIVTDAAINIAPTLDHKRDIAQNAIDLMRLLGTEQPRVAVLAAAETVNASMPATLDAAALTVMAARGQITGGLVDGPLAFDNAISPEAARTKGIASAVAGQADILLVPDLEAGNMLAKQLIYFAGSTAAGLVLGARVPIVLTSRADPLSARIASAALARLIVARKAAEVRA